MEELGCANSYSKNVHYATASYSSRASPAAHSSCLWVFLTETSTKSIVLWTVAKQPCIQVSKIDWLILGKTERPGTRRYDTWHTCDDWWCITGSDIVITVHRNWRHEFRQFKYVTHKMPTPGFPQPQILTDHDPIIDITVFSGLSYWRRRTRYPPLTALLSHLYPI